MTKKEASYIIHYYFRRLITYTEQMNDGLSKEVIHLFRVDVKKLRAFLRMVRWATDAPDQFKFPRKLKKMYSTMGKIRDRQLCLKRIKQNERADDGRFRNEVHSLEKKIKELEEKRSGFLTKNEFEAIEEDIIKVLPIASADVLVSGFFQQKLNVINKIASKSELSDQELHNVRKAIKDIIYITRIYRDDLNMPLPFPFWNEAELQMAESFSHKLGLFNDTCISLSFLASPEINKTKMPAHEHLQVMRRRWLSEKRKLKKRILELYNSSYKSILFDDFDALSKRRTKTGNVIVPENNFRKMNNSERTVKDSFAYETSLNKTVSILDSHMDEKSPAFPP